MHPRFHTAFSALPATLQSALRPYLGAPDFPAMVAGWTMMRWHSRCCRWRRPAR
jgi:hypothetical protein